MSKPNANLDCAALEADVAPQRKRRILFVDDIRTLLISLERLLRVHRHEWDMVFTSSGAEALEMLEKESFDIIVSDVVMPNMTGVELLEIVKERYPSMIRFILSGHADHQTLIQSVGATHQFMAKPCNRDILTEAISRALALRDLFINDDLLRVVKDATSIPTLPELYHELTAELSSSNGTAGRIGEIIAKDVTISAKVLQLVNSAFFGLSRQVDSISQAVTLLGAETINSIVLTTSVFNKFSDHQINRFGIREIYSHSIAVGATASRLVKEAGQEKRDAEEALLAGMMHDLGKLALIDSGNEIWKRLYLDRHNHDVPLHVMERELLGITHAEVGAYLLGVWGLSNTVVEAVAFHHEPGNAPSEPFGPLAAVYLADRFIQKEGDPVRFKDETDMEYLASLGMNDQLNELFERCEHA